MEKTRIRYKNKEFLDIMSERSERAKFFFDILTQPYQRKLVKLSKNEKSMTKIYNYCTSRESVASEGNFLW